MPDAQDEADAAFLARVAAHKLKRAEERLLAAADEAMMEMEAGEES